jgi:two-component system chemotaxis response regulator CheB
MTPPAAIVVGCSAGGVSALQILLGGLDPHLPLPVVVCCHRSADDSPGLAAVLARHTALPVVDAVERQSAAPGVVHLAPPGYHLLMESDCRFALSVDPPVAHARPSIDVLFCSAAQAWRAALIGLVLTGANADGAHGLRRIRRYGGTAVVQDPASAQAQAMPRAALELAGADHCVPLEAIPSLLNRLCLP